jgi:hypothetical protein
VPSRKETPSSQQHNPNIETFHFHKPQFSRALMSNAITSAWCLGAAELTRLWTRSFGGPDVRGTHTTCQPWFGPVPALSSNYSKMHGESPRRWARRLPSHPRLLLKVLSLLSERKLRPGEKRANKALSLGKDWAGSTTFLPRPTGSPQEVGSLCANYEDPAEGKHKIWSQVDLGTYHGPFLTH